MQEDSPDDTLRVADENLAPCSRCELSAKLLAFLLLSIHFLQSRSTFHFTYDTRATHINEFKIHGNWPEHGKNRRLLPTKKLPGGGHQPRSKASPACALREAPDGGELLSHAKLEEVLHGREVSVLGHKANPIHLQVRQGGLQPLSPLLQAKIRLDLLPFLASFR